MYVYDNTVALVLDETIINWHESTETHKQTIIHYTNKQSYIILSAISLIFSLEFFFLLSLFCHICLETYFIHVHAISTKLTNKCQHHHSPSKARIIL